MTGLKYKLAHKRAEKEKWNISDNAQRKRLIQVLQELIDQLKILKFIPIMQMRLLKYITILTHWLIQHCVLLAWLS
jgi:hypothetical protein